MVEHPQDVAPGLVEIGGIRALPDLTDRFWIARPSCATAPSTCSENMRCGVVVSIGLCWFLKCAPTASRRSMPSSRWLTEPARRSSCTTTRVWFGRISRSRRASSGLARSAPEARSSRIVLQPVARSSSSCGPVPWSSVETRIADQAAKCGNFVWFCRHCGGTSTDRPFYDQAKRRKWLLSRAPTASASPVG